MRSLPFYYYDRYSSCLKPVLDGLNYKIYILDLLYYTIINPGKN